ncbi:PilZ domain-containing protein [Pseudomarimonas salicorniae]|uniref:Flagellar brake protein n=1 Tax=Pseudomarimonas salicorniae TaxID=2933270 RepID=A0ABT0GCS1_9GAMM|nr:PilZ domain-containing protein [Lysobacter sp. CAU 1642]MCK7592338.1 flagellar brake protein [Lysobacter sp. CAU 1642]
MSGPAAEPESLSLRALRLRPGMFLQAHPPGDGKRSTEAKFCAAIEGKGLMVVPLHEGQAGAEWREMAELEVRGFTGQYDYRFSTRVLGSFTVPFAYVLLAWPGKVEGRRVRSALRIATSLPAMAWGSDPSLTVPARVVDLSHAGAMIELGTPLGGSGQRVSLALELPLEGGVHALELSGAICHSGEGAAGQGTRVGIAFNGISRTEKALLQNFTLTQLQASGGLA